MWIKAFLVAILANWTGFRVPGVLQRFAIAYLFAFLIQWAFHKSPRELHNIATSGTEHYNLSFRSMHFISLFQIQNKIRI